MIFYCATTGSRFIDQNVPKSGENVFFAIFWYVLVNKSASSCCTVQNHTVLESANHFAHIDTISHVLIKKIIFCKKGPPFAFFGLKKLQLLQFLPDFDDLYLILIRKTYGTRKQVVPIDFPKTVFYASP